MFMLCGSFVHEDSSTAQRGEVTCSGSGSKSQVLFMLDINICC